MKEFFSGLILWRKSLFDFDEREPRGIRKITAMMAYGLILSAFVFFCYMLYFMLQLTQIEPVGLFVALDVLFAIFVLWFGIHILYLTPAMVRVSKNSRK